MSDTTHMPPDRRRPSTMPNPQRRAPDASSVPSYPGDASALLLYLQRTVGNAATNQALRHLFPARSPALQRQVIQRWADAASAQNVIGVLDGMSEADLRALLASFDAGMASATPDATTIGVALPGPTFVSVAVADAVDLRTRTLAKLVERLMETLKSTRDPIAARLNAAPDDAARRSAMVDLHAADAPQLADLRQLTGGQRSRWRHPNAAVEDAVLAAIQLEAVFNAEADLASPSRAHAAAAAACGMDASLEWCGFFVAKEYMVSNLDRDLRAGFFHVDNVEDYFTYTYAFGAHARIKKWIYADDAWHELRRYHADRGSLRHWIDAATIFASGALDIRPGDVAMIDHSGSDRPDHIVMVQSYDPVTHALFTIGGNDGGYEVDTRPGHPAPRGESAAARTKRLRLEASTGQSLRPGDGGGHVGVGMQDLSNQPDPAVVAANPAAARPRTRVFGIGRPSVVDFEDHAYDSTTAKAPPAAPPAHP